MKRVVCGFLLAWFPSLLVAEEPRLSREDLLQYLSNPRSAGAGNYRYGLRDSEGNQMDCPSVIDLGDGPGGYAAVYHSSYQAGGGRRYKIHLATSDDLINWTFRMTLVDNADMPSLTRVKGGEWLMMVHEQWMNATPAGASRSPSRLGFKLFHSVADLLEGKVRSSWIAPSFSRSGLDGTPNVYACELVENDGRREIRAEVGFHFWDGKRDANASARIDGLFSAGREPEWQAVALDAFNAKMISAGVTGNIGQREQVVVEGGRFSVVEGNLGEPAKSWDQWRIWLYQHGRREAGLAASGEGALTMLAPRTHRGSRAFGNPSVSFVRGAGGKGRRIVISYFLFHEGAAPGEAGPLIYFFDLEPGAGETP